MRVGAKGCEGVGGVAGVLATAVSLAGSTILGASAGGVLIVDVEPLTDPPSNADALLALAGAMWLGSTEATVGCACGGSCLVLLTVS